MKHRFFRKVFCAALTVTVGVTACGCVNQHPDSTPTDITAENARLVATSPAVAQICDKLELDLVGVCNTSGTLPDRYKDVKKVGMAMSHELEIFS